MILLLVTSVAKAETPTEARLPSSGRIAVDEHPRRELLWWASPTPYSIGDDDEDRPGYDVYLPPADQASGTAVIICPGGGYGTLTMQQEGQQIARWLNSHGIAAFVLHYRVPPRYTYPAPLVDAQRSIRLVRAKAKEYHVHPDRIGIWGFSAGGHIASTAGTHFDDGDPRASDPIDSVSSRPDFMILTYPVISLSAPFVQKMPKLAMLGTNPDPKLMTALSNEKQVTSRTPPTFLFHSHEDTGVPAENSVVFYLALRQHNVPAELHVYEQPLTGGGKDSVLTVWPERLAEWLRLRELSTSPAKLAKQAE